MKPDFRILIMSLVGGALGGAMVERRDFRPNIELTNEFNEPDRDLVTGIGLAS